MYLQATIPKRLCESVSYRAPSSSSSSSRFFQKSFSHSIAYNSRLCARSRSSKETSFIFCVTSSILGATHCVGKGDGRQRKKIKVVAGQPSGEPAPSDAQRVINEIIREAREREVAKTYSLHPRMPPSRSRRHSVGLRFAYLSSNRKGNFMQFPIFPTLLGFDQGL